MLELDVLISELYNEETRRFSRETVTLQLEHSLVSLSKWESKYEKPFLSSKIDDKTDEETLNYIRMMILTKDYPEDILMYLSKENLDKIEQYILSKQTATWFNDPPGPDGRKSNQVVTSELIYYWMTSYRIPWEAQYWHLSRLITLIKVFSAENEKDKPKKKSTTQSLAARRALNEQRKRQMNSNG